MPQCVDIMTVYKFETNEIFILAISESQIQMKQKFLPNLWRRLKLMYALKLFGALLCSQETE